MAYKKNYKQWNVIIIKHNQRLLIYKVMFLKYQANAKIFNTISNN